MKTNDVIWLLIRIAGLYFLWQCFESVVALISNFVAFSESPGLLEKSTGVQLQILLRIGLYLGLGIYMLANGSLFFQVLNRQPDSDDRQNRSPYIK
jgi:hypothetical protein